MDEIRKDERFAHITSDPRFRSMSKKERKVKIDKRFQGMFQDKRFKLKYTIDKRGRPVQFTTSENLKKFYDLSDDENDENESIIDSEDGENLNIESKVDKKVKKHQSKIDEDSDEESDDNGDEESDDNGDEESDDNGEEEIDETVDKSSDNLGDEKGGYDFKIGENEPDYARGEAILESSSSEDDDDDDDEEDGVKKTEDLEHAWGEMDKDVPRTEDSSCRIAVCNMDWDRTKAQDIFILINSFKPANGVIKSVCVYPSEFGLQRLKEEETSGPSELKVFAKEVNCSDDESSEDDKNDEAIEYQREKLRVYQLNRLKYYYAVIECDSIVTADKIYKDCDGLEYESTCSRLDLRFIPDDVTFDVSADSKCTCLPDTTSYKVPTFTTSALGQSKVDLTWDETSHDRIKITMQKFDKLSDYNTDDFKTYLASDSEDETMYDGMIASSDENSDVEFDEEEHIAKYKSLLQEIDESNAPKNDMEMEIVWEPGLKETAENIVKNKEKGKGQSTWDTYLDRKKEKRKQRKEEMKKKLSKKERRDEKAFSDDDMPSDVDIGHVEEELGEKKKKGKKGKGKKKRVKLTQEEEEEEKKKEAELALLMMDEDDDDRDHFKLNDLVEKEKKKKKKKKYQKETTTKSDDFEVDVKDDRFGAIFKSHLFNIDPSAPEYKKTKGMEALITEKLKRRQPDSYYPSEKKKKLEVATESDDIVVPENELSSLIKSVKTKTELFKKQKKLKKHKK